MITRHSAFWAASLLVALSACEPGSLWADPPIPKALKGNSPFICKPQTPLFPKVFEEIRVAKPVILKAKRYTPEIRRPLVKAIGGLPTPITDYDYHPTSTDKVELGRLLFFDRILSGNKNISCATCHHPKTSTSDALSLGIGEGGKGIGIRRNTGTGRHKVKERVPRNSPALFNLGAKEFTTMFHDGRVELIGRSVRSPANENLPYGLDSPLAIQAMFPVTSATEMAGQKGENSIADATDKKKWAGSSGVWGLLARRVYKENKYYSLFRRVYPHQVRKREDIDFVMIANAMAAYQTETYRSDKSPFDHYLRGNFSALNESQKRGMNLFYGKANCASCHSGKFQTDHQFYSIAMPQIGPGKGHGYKKHEDYGRGDITKRTSDRYKFRTPSLRNVELTAPYGHSGTYKTLEGVVRHHLDPVTMLHRYDARQRVMPSRSDLDAKDLIVHKSNTVRNAIAASSDLPRISLSTQEIRDIVEFLKSLTDPNMRDLRHLIPSKVPSGLAID